MSKKILVTIPDTHAKWLDELSKKKGLESIQDAIRDVIKDAYEHRQPKGG